MGSHEISNPRSQSRTDELTGRARPVLALLGVLETRYSDLTDHGRTVGTYCRALAARSDAASG